MVRSDYLADAYFNATGKRLVIENHGGTIDFTVTALLPYGAGIHQFQSRLNPDGSYTFLGSNLVRMPL